jgi:hypothetical protein
MGRGGASGAGQGRSVDEKAPESKGRDPELPWILNHGALDLDPGEAKGGRKGEGETR